MDCISLRCLLWTLWKWHLLIHERDVCFSRKTMCFSVTIIYLKNVYSSTTTKWTGVVTTGYTYGDWVLIGKSTCTEAGTKGPLDVIRVHNVRIVKRVVGARGGIERRNNWVERLMCFIGRKVCHRRQVAMELGKEVEIYSVNMFQIHKYIHPWPAHQWRTE